MNKINFIRIYFPSIEEDARPYSLPIPCTSVKDQLSYKKCRLN